MQNITDGTVKVNYSELVMWCFLLSGENLNEEDLFVVLLAFPSLGSISLNKIQIIGKPHAFEHKLNVLM